MSRLPLYPESHFVNRIGGANDGILSAASLIVGVAAAAATQNDVSPLGGVWQRLRPVNSTSLQTSGPSSGALNRGCRGTGGWCDVDGRRANMCPSARNPTPNRLISHANARS
jgi:hypothetical protein